MKLFTSSLILIMTLFIMTCAFASERKDKHTQRNEMHSCGTPTDPAGEFVTGVHVKKNWLLCSDEFDTPRVGGTENFRNKTELWQIEDRFVPILQCLPGSAVTGIHVDRKALACAPIIPPITMPLTYFPDRGVTQREGMHACPKGYPLAGINVKENILLCGAQY